MPSGLLVDEPGETGLTSSAPSRRHVSPLRDFGWAPREFSDQNRRIAPDLQQSPFAQRPIIQRYSRPQDVLSGRAVVIVAHAHETHAELFPPGRLTGPVQFFSKLLDLWRIDPDRSYALLGYEADDADHVGDILRGVATLRGRDAKDRISHLYMIRSALSSLFGNVSVENEWLREPQEALDDASPYDMLLEGSMENLLRVRYLVDVMAGRAC